MKKLLAVLLILTMAAALAGSALAVSDEADIAADDPAQPVELETASDEALIAETDSGDATMEPIFEEPSAEPSGEIQIVPSSGPIKTVDMYTFTPIVGRGAEAIQATGTLRAKTVFDFYWTGPDGEKITLDEGVFQSGVYTLSVTFKAAEGYELTDPVNLWLKGKVQVGDSISVSSTGVDEAGTPIYELKDFITLAAAERSASGEMGGGWIQPESDEITPELRDVFERAVSELMGVNYEPVAYLGYQLVNGTNHLFSATQTVVYPGAVTETGTILIHEDPDGSARVYQTGFTIYEEPSGPELTVTLSEDAKDAQCYGYYDGLYVRVALVIDNCGESGLYVTPGVINDGRIVIPQFDVPGLTVTGVCVALVASQGDITSPSPVVLAEDHLYF